MLRLIESQPLMKCASHIEVAISNAFADLEEITAQVLSVWQGASTKTGRPTISDVSAIRPAIENLLRSDQLKFHGAGVAFATTALTGRDLHIEWSCNSECDTIKPLNLNFNRSSDHFYDYVSMPWFTGPQTSRRPMITGPFVDLYGTKEYILAFSMPIMWHETFIGVAAADISLHSLEPMLLNSLVGLPNPAALLNGEGRVLAANTAEWFAGDLIKLGSVSGIYQSLSVADGSVPLDWSLFEQETRGTA